MVTGAKVLPETLVKDNGVTIQAEHNGENKEFKAEKCLYLWDDKPIRKILV